MKPFLWIALFLCAWPATSQETADLVGKRGGQASQQSSSAENHFLLGENQKALEAYGKARELFLAIGDELGQGHTWEGEADVLLRLGDEHEALDAYRHARELFRAAGDQLGQGDTWRGEAKALDQLGEKKEALEACERAQLLFRAARKLLLPTREQLRLGHTWYGEAEILYQLSEKKERASPSQALYGYREARRLYLAASNKLGEGNTWRGEGDALLRRGEYKRALDAYSKARQLFIVVGDQEGQGNTWLGEAQVKMAMRLPGGVSNLIGAIKAAATAITNYQSAGVVSKQTSALLIKAEAEKAEAQEEAKMAQSMATRIPVGGHFWVSISYVRKPPVSTAQEAILLEGIWRGTGTTDVDRTRREDSIRWAYDFLVTLRARQRGKAAEALRLAEEARSRVLLDLLAAPADPGGVTSAADQTEERRQLETEISKIEKQLRGSPTLDQRVKLRVQKLQLELKWNEAGKKSLPQEPPLNAAAIQNLARETGPLLVYYVAESEVWGFLIRPETAEIYTRSITISRPELKNKISTFVHDLSNPLEERRAEAQALILRSLLIDPFIDHLPKSGPLVLVPHGPLHELPFEALRDDKGKRLFEHWQISFAPSVSVLAFARHHHAASLPNDSFVGFSSGRGLNLPAEEIDKISQLFQFTYHPTVANFQEYKDHAPQARQLLLSTHGKYGKGSRSETYLEIEPIPGVHDGRLTAAEIANIPLKAELVTLAACETSYGPALLSDERLNVTRSFLIAGAAAVLASRWSLPEDEATSRFLADFYSAYSQKGLRKDEALAEARHLSRERNDRAAVWAAWVLIGDAR